MIGTFILNDENKANSYGFRIPNKGINLTRFLANPVMLDSHVNSNSTVLGKWKNTRIEGSKLIAEPEFDLEDAEAKEIEGKVRRGFIKGASMGIIYSKDNMQMSSDGVWELIKCELLEVSIVAVPSNANAISLFSKNGQLINENTLRLSFQPFGLNVPSFSSSLSGTFSHPSEIVTIDCFERLSNAEKMRFKINFAADYNRLFKSGRLPEMGATFSVASEIESMDDFEKLSETEKRRFKLQFNSNYINLFRKDV